MLAVRVEECVVWSFQSAGMYDKVSTVGPRGLLEGYIYWRNSSDFLKPGDRIVRDTYYIVLTDGTKYKLGTGAVAPKMQVIDLGLMEGGETGIHVIGKPELGIGVSSVLRVVAIEYDDGRDAILDEDQLKIIMAELHDEVSKSLDNLTVDVKDELRTEMQSLGNTIKDTLRTELAAGDASVLSKADTKVSALRSDIEANMSALSGSVDTKIASVRTDVDNRVTAVRGEVNTLRTDTDTKISTLRTDMDSKVDALRTEVTNHVSTLRSETDTKVSTLRTEVGTHVSTLRTETDTKVEALRNSLEPRIVLVENSVTSLGSEMESLQRDLSSAVEDKVRLGQWTLVQATVGAGGAFYNMLHDAPTITKGDEIFVHQPSGGTLFLNTTRRNVDRVLELTMTATLDCPDEYKGFMNLMLRNSAGGVQVQAPLYFDRHSGTIRYPDKIQWHLALYIPGDFNDHPIYTNGFKLDFHNTGNKAVVVKPGNLSLRLTTA